MEFETVTLENGKDYAIVIEKENYLLLVNINDSKDQCIRKNVIKDNENYIETLDSDAELLKAIKILLPN